MLRKDVEKILLKVQKPGRYVGGELNEVIKEKQNIDLRFAFCFPDTYEIGMSNLGMKILYSLLNEEEYIWCERCFAPWIDMEEEMKKNNIPLYCLESGDCLDNFDIIGFSLGYELSYSNVLNMLKLGNVPIKASDRKGLKNLVVAGGACACNPEPISEFIDLFFLGDGEEVDLELCKLYRECKKNNVEKDEFLILASKISGVYVPSLYNYEYNEDGTIDSILPSNGAPFCVEKRLMMDMDKSYYPKTFVVPNIEIVFDRVQEEIFRGCTRGCRFCQAGFMNRPVREKSVDVINNQAKALCESTGYDEISLTSLSSSDYSEIVPLLTKMVSWTNDNGISISLPSLRVDGFSDDILSKLKTVRKSGLTFAPEAGTQRLRDAINKNVYEDELIATCKTAFSGGYTNVKLYFMIGLPTETDEDVIGIAKLAQKVVDAYYQTEDRVKGKSVNVTISTSSFVPKPFTPFEFEAQDTVEELVRKQRLIKDNIESKKITYNYHDSKTSFLEAAFARGDRRLNKVLELAAEKNLHFDSWNDCFDFDKWLECFKEANIDMSFYANRKRDYDEIMPWDHLNYGVSKDFFISENKKAYESKVTKGCMEKCSNCGANKYNGGICYAKL